MALILCIETATPICSVALYHKDKLVAISELFLEKSHATHLTSMIDQVLEQADESRDNLDAVAVSEGPGSYTGLRIGASTAKGMAFALEIPLIAVPTLESMAYGVRQTQGLPMGLCPMLDARRMEVYCQLFAPHGVQLWDTRAIVVESIESFQEQLDQFNILFFGDGMPKLQGIFKPHPHARFIENVYPSAKSMGPLAWLRYRRQSFEDVAYWEPNYLKEFQAGKPKQR